MKDDWTLFKKTFTQKQEDALYQFFIDHSRIQKNGYYGIMFYIKDIDDFWRRVYARYTGDYKRYDILEKEYRRQQLAVHYFKKIAYRRSKACDQIDKNGTVYSKIMLFLYRKSRDYIDNYK